MELYNQAAAGLMFIPCECGIVFAWLLSEWRWYADYSA
jgi:hypothetical protein